MFDWVEKSKLFEFGNTENAWWVTHLSCSEKVWVWRPLKLNSSWACKCDTLSCAVACSGCILFEKDVTFVLAPDLRLFTPRTNEPWTCKLPKRVRTHCPMYKHYWWSFLSLQDNRDSKCLKILSVMFAHHEFFSGSAITRLISVQCLSVVMHKCHPFSLFSEVVCILCSWNCLLFFSFRVWFWSCEQY